MESRKTAISYFGGIRVTANRILREHEALRDLFREPRSAAVFSHSQTQIYGKAHFWPPGLTGILKRIGAPISETSSLTNREIYINIELIKSMIAGRSADRSKTFSLPWQFLIRSVRMTHGAQHKWPVDHHTEQWF
jgi:hypothetical protein